MYLKFSWSLFVCLFVLFICVSGTGQFKRSNVSGKDLRLVKLKGIHQFVPTALEFDIETLVCQTLVIFPQNVFKIATFCVIDYILFQT